MSIWCRDAKEWICTHASFAFWFDESEDVRACCKYEYSCPLLVLPNFLTTLAGLEKVARIALELLVIPWLVGPVLSEGLVCHMKELQRYFFILV